MLHFVGCLEDWPMNAPTRTPKQQAHELIDQLPDTATWSELAYTLEVRADIEEGVADIEAGRVSSVAEIRSEYGLPE
jgi:predicted transcriptional regulator